MRGFFERNAAALLTLLACAAAYAAFHLARPRLGAGVFWGSTPSFLLPIAMATTFDLAPRVRFRSRANRAIAVIAATLVAAVWFEGIVPTLVESSTGDWRDTAAMLVGGAVAALAPFVRDRLGFTGGRGSRRA